MNDVFYNHVVKPRYRMSHPGSNVASVLEDLRIPIGTAARRIGVSPNNLRKILAGKSPITPRIAGGIGRYFGNGPRIWIALQQSHDRSVGYAERRSWPYLLYWRLQKYEWSNRTILSLKAKVE